MNNRAIQYTKLYKQWKDKETNLGNFLAKRAFWESVVKNSKHKKEFKKYRIGMEDGLYSYCAFHRDNINCDCTKCLKKCKGNIIKSPYIYTSKNKYFRFVSLGDYILEEKGRKYIGVPHKKGWVSF